jgi:hypothetical protein
MTPAIELVQKITAAGGSIRAEDGLLVVAPRGVVAPFLDELRRRKPELLALLRPSASAPPVDPDAWREPFARWLDSACVAHPRCFGGLNALHRAYSDWELSHDGVPPTRDTFVALLVECGFRIVDIHGTALLEGLALCEDVDVYYPRRHVMEIPPLRWGTKRDEDRKKRRYA